MANLSRTELADKVKQKIEEVKRIVERNGPYVLTTCFEYERGLYGADPSEYRPVTPTARALRDEGYRVEKSFRHGLKEYTIYPKE